VNIIVASIELIMTMTQADQQDMAYVSNQYAQDQTRVSLRAENVFAFTGSSIDESKFSFFDMYLSLSTALDLVDPRLGDHHKLTCYIAAQLARHLGLVGDDYRRVFASALIHDIGATSLHERIQILEFDGEASTEHALVGEAILKSVDPLADLAAHVGDHHVIWDHGAGQEHRGREVSLISHIIQLADRVAVLIDRKAPLILLQSSGIRDKIHSKSGKLFSSELADAFCDMSKNANFWLGMDPAFLGKSLRDLSSFQDVYLSLSELENLSSVFAFIIDSRSRFTASHSSGVAVVAENLGMAYGLSDQVCRKLKIAGYLHDIGKLSVPSEILEKEGKLSEEERAIMNGHSFYTEKIIANVRGLDEIGSWASHHHEFLDGRGYPHGLSEQDLGIPERIMTIADIFTALTEDRPYRKGMEMDEALKIIDDFADRGKIDKSVTHTLHQNVGDIDCARRAAQTSENKKLDAMWERAAEYVSSERA